jgi:hypothetical protein
MEISMATHLLPHIEQRVELSGISWQTYETLLHELRDREYTACTQSLAFPNLPLLEIQSFLEHARVMDYLDTIDAFRRWVKSQIH